MTPAPPLATSHEVVNVGGRLAQMAAHMPDQDAVIWPTSYDRHGKRRYERRSFRELDQDSDRIARGLIALGASPGTRLALMVRPSFDFISLVFALLKCGAVQILIDPGIGRSSLLKCLDDSQPQGFVAIPLVHAVRKFLGKRYPQAKINVTVGRRLFWDGVTLEQLRGGPWEGPVLVPTRADDPAAVIFTSGSTGPPKGVLYRHGNFNGQVDQIRDRYDIRPGESEVSCFPLFALFNAAMGVTTIVPEMDFTRPASVDPRMIVEVVHDLCPTQAFASPAVWNRVGRHCQQHGLDLFPLRRVLSAGAPVPGHVLERMKKLIHPDGEIYTPYGATEALPVASVSASEVLSETRTLTEQGRGVCVGRRFSGIEWRVVKIVDGPIPTLEDAQELPAGEIGELIVRGPVVTREYHNRPQANEWGKIANGADVWHRMGDVGYLDERERFWFCGRLTQRVVTPDETLFTIPCEAIFNAHAAIFRSALVGVGERGDQRPVIVAEPEQWPKSMMVQMLLVDELLSLAQANPLTKNVHDVLLHRSLPVDIRHNAKIFREKLAVWAAGKLKE